MVYINLSVLDIEQAVTFYVTKLGLFTLHADTRLICSIDVELTLDLVQSGTDKHKKIFGQDAHVISSFWISPSGASGEAKICILDATRKNGIEYEEVGNLGGHYLLFRDPSNNRFMLHASHGIIQ